MQIASITICGRNAEIIGAALESVAPFVDLFVVLDTAGDVPTWAEACRVAMRLDKPIRRGSFPWIDDFAAARNAALDAATVAGATWAFILDTDERIEANGESIRRTILEADSAGSGALMMREAGGTYAKARALRLPCPIQYVGETHEVIAAHKLRPREFERAVFSELAKSPEQLRAKFERDLLILTGMCERDDRNPRTYFYLGDTCRNLGRMAPLAIEQAPGADRSESRENWFENAIAHYELCASLPGWDEQRAFACYRAAEICCSLSRWEAAIDRCAQGLARHAGIAELCWLAGYASHKCGRHAQAIYWAQLATTHGLAEGDGELVPRIGFRHLPGLYDGPFDVLRFAHLALGNQTAADLAALRCERAMMQRFALERGPAKHDETRP